MKQSILNKLKSKLRQQKLSLSTHKSSESLNRKLFDSVTHPLWYQQDYNREQSESFLSDKQIGVFVMRKSETILDCFVLSVKVPKYVNPKQTSHYLVVRNTDTKSYSIRGFQKEFHDLSSLVTHCSFMRDMLPITLNLEHYVSETKCNQHKLNDLVYYSSYNSKTSLHSVSSTSSGTSSIDSLEEDKEDLIVELIE